MRTYNLSNQIVLSIIVNGGSFLYGISLGWNSVFESLYQLFDDKWFSWTFLLASVGAALTCVIAGIFRDRFGTKFAIFVFSIPNVVGWLLLILTDRAVSIIFGRLLIALSSGAYCLIIPFYVGEIASKEVRGMLLIFFDLGIKLGALFSYILFRYTSTFVISIICGSLSLVYMLAIFYIPESPLYLFHKKKFGPAVESIIRIRGDAFNYQDEIAELQLQSDELDGAKGVEDKANKQITVSIPCRTARRKSLTIIISMFFFMQLSGINVVLFYASDIFGLVTSLNPMIIIYIIQAITTLATMLLIDRYGRKILLISSLFMTMIGLIGNGTFFLVGYDGIEWILLLFLIVFLIGFNLGISGIPFVLFGELFTLDSKRIVAPTALTLNFAFSYFVTLIFTLLARVVGTEIIFFIFAFISLIALCFVQFLVPETKGKTMLEIQLELREKTFYGLKWKKDSKN